MKMPSIISLLAISLVASAVVRAEWPPSPVVDTGQQLCYDIKKPIKAPSESSRYFGQDGQYQGVQPSYEDNGDGTVTDLVTGLVWSQATAAEKVTLEEAEAIAEEMTLGGHDDWRVPNIKELYSLMDFRGVTGLMGPGSMDKVPATSVPYINTDYFEFRYGDVASGERFIDAQWLSTTFSVSPIMHGTRGLFGVNFADGRIKCYGLENPRRGEKKFYARYVRGRTDYSENDYIDNGDGTVTDRATGLTWMQDDSGRGMDWQDALSYAKRLELGGHDDWRLPNAKELLSIVDYTRSPDATDSAAIDPIFEVSQIENEADEDDFPYFWTSTTHLDGPNARQTVYVTFGRAIGEMQGRVIDAHGAGAQRSDPKEGEAQLGHGPQGDAQRVENFVRCVRGGAVLAEGETTNDSDAYPNLVHADGRSYRPEPMTFRDTPARHDVDRESGAGSDRRPPPHLGGGGMGPPPRR